MAKVGLGGIKVVENRAFLCSKRRAEGEPLRHLCSSFSAGRINMGLLAHLADDGSGRSITAVSAKTAVCLWGLVPGMEDEGGCRTAELAPEVSRISLFPHGQRPGVAARILAVLSGAAIRPLGLCSSPSAVTLVVSSTDFEPAMERFFETFDFPACGSYGEWKSLCRMDEHQLSEVRFSYNEEIITVYGFAGQSGWDLWNSTVPVGSAGEFGEFLSDLDKSGFRLPFLISQSAPGEREMHFAFALESDRRKSAEKTLNRVLPDAGYNCRTSVSTLFLHGPHFGDRYGIADAFVTALRNGGVPLLALSCAVSSISGIIGGSGPERAIEVLNARFQTPAGAGAVTPAL